MSRVEELIRQLCPNGVEWKKLGEVCEIKTGKGITQKDCTDERKYPVVSGGTTYMGYFKEYNRNENTVTISRVGANAGFVNFIVEKFYLNDKCFSVIPYQSKIVAKFLFYILKSIEAFLINLQSEGGVPTINIAKVGNIEIPIPPIPIQQEIVRILDTFTKLTANLQTELDARKKQYAYYRDCLLNFEGADGVEWKKLGEVCEILDSQRRPVEKTKRSIGKYPYYGANGIQDYVDDFLFNGTFLLVGEDGSVINKDNSPILNWATGKIWVNNHAHILSERKEIMSLRFLYFVLSVKDISKLVRGVPPKLNQVNLRNIEIPIPPLPIQQEIVRILDTFTELTANLQTELEARRKQYEYYRDKLLTFDSV